MLVSVTVQVFPLNGRSKLSSFLVARASHDREVCIGKIDEHVVLLKDVQDAVSLILLHKHFVVRVFDC